MVRGRMLEQGAGGSNPERFVTLLLRYAKDP
jgi:hypothetical protein